ncbi:hypothetical protein OG912_16780 [Streptomyces sp. NBC_00464]|uniref:hypothetical protein n=1 Tax=Streptomyces sp. NBC_00464 TaxID=2975751 RepID=UPI002E18FE3E
MLRIRILEAVSGLDFSWQPGDLVELAEEEAAKWADGYRAVWADEIPSPPPVAPDRVPPADDLSQAEAFDPAEHSNREVLAYLVDVGEEEAVRVLDVEASGQNRAGIAKERETVLAQARANDETRAAADQADAELAAEASHGGDLRDGIETR